MKNEECICGPGLPLAGNSAAPGSEVTLGQWIADAMRSRNMTHSTGTTAGRPCSAEGAGSHLTMQGQNSGESAHLVVGAAGAAAAGARHIGDGASSVHDDRKHRRGHAQRQLRVEVALQRTWQLLDQQCLIAQLHPVAVPLTSPEF